MGNLQAERMVKDKNKNERNRRIIVKMCFGISIFSSSVAFQQSFQLKLCLMDLVWAEHCGRENTHNKTIYVTCYTISLLMYQNRRLNDAHVLCLVILFDDVIKVHTKFMILQLLVPKIHCLCVRLFAVSLFRSLD